MEPATATVQIRRPRAEVHALLSDLARHAEYLDHFLVDWTITSESSRGVGASARVRAKGGGGDDAIEATISSVTPDAIVLETRGGRRQARRIRLVYALEEVGERTTQVTTTVELVKGSVVDQVTWAIPRAHLERQYAQGLLRLKGLVEGKPAAR